MTNKYDIEQFLEAARKETGLSDFDDDHFIKPLQKLLDSVAEEVTFNEMGAMAFQADTQRFLTNRLRFAEDVKRNPEMLQEDVSDPIIILGLARTGTSKLQRMMSADPNAQKLYLWRLLNPARILNTEADQEQNIRIEIARQASAMARQMFPRFNAAHPMIADEVDEELLLAQFSFENLVMYMMNPAHGYFDWIKDQDLSNSYQYLKQMIQYLQWQDGGKQGRRWIMKSPLHIGNLESLLKVFPNATLVHCHRDINEVIPSFCNLQEAAWLMRTDSVDPLQVGEAMMDLWGTEMDKYLQSRKQLGDKLHILDVSYKRINKSPIEVITEVYQKAGVELTADSIAAMEKWQQDNPKNRHGKNTYSLGQYGLSEEKINARFAPYLKQFSQYT